MSERDLKDMREFPLGLDLCELRLSGKGSLKGTIKADFDGEFEGQRLVLFGVSRRCRSCGALKAEPIRVLDIKINGKAALGLATAVPAQMFQPEMTGVRLDLPRMKAADELIVEVDSFERRVWYRPWRWFATHKLRGALIGIKHDAVESKEPAAAPDGPGPNDLATLRAGSQASSAVSATA